MHARSICTIRSYHAPLEGRPPPRPLPRHAGALSAQVAEKMFDREVAVWHGYPVETALTEADVVRGLQTLASLPDAMRLAFQKAGGKGDPASVATVKPWAVRAASALGEPVSESARAVLDGAMPVLHARYQVLVAAYRRAGAGELERLPAAVVGAAGAATGAVAAALRAAWPVIVRGAVAVGRLLGKHPIKAVAATAAAAALPGAYKAGKDLGEAASKVTAELVPAASGLLAGMGLPLVVLLAFLLLRK